MVQAASGEAPTTGRIVRSAMVEARRRNQRIKHVRIAVETARQHVKLAAGRKSAEFVKALEKRNAGNVQEVASARNAEEQGRPIIPGGASKRN